MLITVDEIVKEHLKASRKIRKSFKGSPAKARKLLIEIGVLDKNGKQLATAGIANCVFHSSFIYFGLPRL